MEFHFGRLADHVHPHVGDTKCSSRFYQEALGAVG